MAIAYSANAVPRFEFAREVTEVWLSSQKARHFVVEIPFWFKVLPFVKTNNVKNILIEPKPFFF